MNLPAAGDLMTEVLYLVAAASTFATTAAGFLLGRRSVAREHKPEAAPKLLCSCQHGFGIHEARRGCNAQISRRRNMAYTDTEWVKCPCLKYDGPIPIEEFLPPSIAIKP